MVFTPSCEEQTSSDLGESTDSEADTTTGCGDVCEDVSSSTLTGGSSCAGLSIGIGDRSGDTCGLSR